MLLNNYNLNYKFWRNKKVLITGAHGFVGKNLLEELKNFQKIVDFKILYPSRKQLNLIDQKKTNNYFLRNKPDIVLHLAGKVGGIGINKEKQGDFFYENILMGVNILHSSMLNKVKKIICLAAGCGYPEKLKPPFKEVDFWQGLPDENSLGYSMAKKNLIIQSWVYKKQYNLNSVVLIPANIYGPYDNFNLKTSHVVPALIKKFINAKINKKQKVEIWGDGSASRELLFVKDLVAVILNAAEKVNECGPFNVGTGVETKIKDLIKNIQKILNFENSKIYWKKNMPNGQKRRRYNMSNYNKRFIFKNFTKLNKGLKFTIDWYFKNLK